MKKLLILTLTIGIISIVLMIFFFLASSDIYHEYIGSTILSKGIIGNVENLPEWTSCKSEWLLLQIDYSIRFIFMILVTVVLVKMIRNPDEKL